MTKPEETEIWTEDDYNAIDAVAPYNAENRYYTAEDVLDRAKKRTQAWLQAAETLTA